jgi:nitrogen-specific signal transduction histidine kinase
MNPFNDPALHTLIHDTNNSMEGIRHSLSFLKNRTTLTEQQQTQINIINERLDRLRGAIDKYYVAIKQRYK